MKIHKKKRLLFALLLFPVFLYGQEPAEVFVFDIKTEIGPSSNRHVRLALLEAEQMNADYVIIDMDTYGGAVNDADAIRMRLLEFEKPLFVFIDKNAASAGALISIACDSIYMTKGANIGAATVVNGADGAKAPDKYQSYMRSMMRSTAEANGRNPKIAEAMVDENLEVEGVSSEGQVITFTVSEAIEHGFCEAEVNTIEDILERNGIDNYEITRYEPSDVDGVIAFFLSPAISGFLILVIIGGIYYELQTPGVGFPILAACIAGVLYFIPYYLEGLAANWEIIAFVVGVLLIAAEIFVIPGFGIAGISGILLTLGSLILVMLDNDFLDFRFVPTDSLLRSIVVTLGGGVGALILMVVGASRIATSPFFKRVALQETLEKSEGYTSSFHKEDMIGKEGVAYTVLRPSGKVMIDDEIYDAFTRGNFIQKVENIVVIAQEGTSIKVKKA